jgi:hypothetical protein
VAKFDKVIPPGQEGKIVLEVKGDKVHGDFKKNASVFSNDPEHPMMTITVEGSVKHYIDVLPTDRIYLTGIYGENVEQEVAISSNEKTNELKILGVESNLDDKITYKLKSGGSPGKYILKVWKNPLLPVLKTWGSITLHTNSESAPNKVIQVSVTTTSLIKAHPSMINFGRVNANVGEGNPESYKKTITVEKLKGEFKIKNVAFMNDNYSAVVQPLEIGKKYSVTVTFNPGGVRKGYSSEMIINTDDPLEPTVKVRLLARTI